MAQLQVSVIRTEGGILGVRLHQHRMCRPICRHRDPDNFLHLKPHIGGAAPDHCQHIPLDLKAEDARPAVNERFQAIPGTVGGLRIWI
jgi:hypothetical protein